MDIVTQLGELLLSAIPTVIMFLLIWGAYRVIVHKKLTAVLAERHARTQGAIEQAQREIASAEGRTAEYERRLQEARSQIYKKQDASRKHLMEQRAAALAEARSQAQVMIQQGRAALDKDISDARRSLQQQAEILAGQIIETVLKPAAAGGR